MKEWELPIYRLIFQLQLTQSIVFHAIILTLWPYDMSSEPKDWWLKFFEILQKDEIWSVNPGNPRKANSIALEKAEIQRLRITSPDRTDVKLTQIEFWNEFC